jgi:hypothetical protein
MHAGFNSALAKPALLRRIPLGATRQGEQSAAFQRLHLILPDCGNCSIHNRYLFDEQAQGRLDHSCE